MQHFLFKEALDFVLFDFFVKTYFEYLNSIELNHYRLEIHRFKNLNELPRSRAIEVSKKNYATNSRMKNSCICGKISKAECYTRRKASRNSL